MRSPFSKVAGPRIRALTGAPSRAKAGGPAPSRATAASPARAPAAPASAPQAVFREFVATLERLEKSRRRRKTPAASAREG